MSQALMLHDGEQVVHSWNGLLTEKVVVRNVEKRRFRRDKVRTGKKTEQERGVLVLSNQRLAWMQRRGRISKSYHLSFDIPLEQLAGISLGGTVFKYVTLSDGDHSYQLNLKGVGSKEFQYFKDMVMRQRDKIRSSSPSQITREVITKEVVMIPCEYCKGLMPQTSTFCPNCGAQRKG
jgi:hypothetical protein